VVKGTTISFGSFDSYTGTEAVTNGTFATVTTGWTAANSATLSVASAKLRVARNAVANPGATQAITGLLPGYTYRFSVVVDIGTADSTLVLVTATTAGTTLLSDVSGTGTYAANFVAPSDGAITILLRAVTNTGTNSADFDTVSVKQAFCTIADSGAGLGQFPAGATVLVRGSPLNSRRWLVAANVSTSLIEVDPGQVQTEAAGSTIILEREG